MRIWKNSKELAFSNCSHLSSIVIPDKVSVIGYYCFYECTELSSVTIGNSVKSIKGYAFYKCEKIESVHFPNSVSTIGEKAFQWCKNLKTIVLGSGTYLIDQFAFYPCASMTNVYCFAERVPWLGPDVFSRLDATLHVPAVSLEDYKSSSSWGKFANIVVLSDEDTSGIRVVQNGINTTESYSISGMFQSQNVKGVSIIRQKDGLTKKVIIK